MRKRTVEAMRRARRALMRGVVRSICPECYEIADEDGLITRVELAPLTLVAGSPAAIASTSLRSSPARDTSRCRW
jgi:hypothetical protein